MSVPPSEASAITTSGTLNALDRVKTDKDIHAGLSTLKRVLIQSVVSALSFVIATGIAFLVEKWLHFLESEMELNQIPIAPLFKVALPYITGFLLIGLSVIATILAFREAWHIGGHHVGDESHKDKGQGVHSVPPVLNVSTKQQLSSGSGNRAERRRRNRR